VNLYSAQSAIPLTRCRPMY